MNSITATGRRVLEALRKAGRRGLTAEELIGATGLNKNTAPPLLTEFAQAGVVVPVGVRPTAAGKRATAWALSSLAGDAQPIVTHTAGFLITTRAGDRSGSARRAPSSSRRTSPRAR